MCLKSFLLVFWGNIFLQLPVSVSRSVSISYFQFFLPFFAAFRMLPLSAIGFFFSLEIYLTFFFISFLAGGVNNGWKGWGCHMGGQTKKIKIVLPLHVKGQSRTIAFGSFGSFFTIHFTVSGLVSMPIC
jgi:hypothetical protein